ncbi:hypothetical protein SBI_07527 [Streptomyces bingchenggensis BCW-1]|uniref:Uncharacterized protein n=1 Tax=Streptomyces bingchenggensis (strain BCW-1) TaxID=749414 RepID=D7C9C9_STRBB|nr:MULTISPECIES: hypothetical protein [Streptomyces]ADI10647.1 hypothetical protein SBI_07527 [Streptomyces bingchenggensis BCW-1]
MAETHDAIPAPRAASAASATRAKGAAGTAAGTATGTAGTSGAIPEIPNGPTFPVLPPSEQDELARRLRHAVSGFVDAPRDAVEEADLLLDELSGRLADLLADRRRTLQDAWRENESGTVRTEDLRLAMRGYRNVLDRLLSI